MIERYMCVTHIGMITSMVGLIIGQCTKYTEKSCQKKLKIFLKSIRVHRRVNSTNEKNSLRQNKTKYYNKMYTEYTFLFVTFQFPFSFHMSITKDFFFERKKQDLTNHIMMILFSDNNWQTPFFVNQPTWIMFS